MLEVMTSWNPSMKLKKLEEAATSMDHQQLLQCVQAFMSGEVEKIPQWNEKLKERTTSSSTSSSMRYAFLFGNIGEYFEN